MISDAVTVRLVESLSPAECQTLFGRQIQPGHQTRVLARTITLSRMLRYLANRHLYPDFEWLSCTKLADIPPASNFWAW